MARSTDGGDSFINFKISENPFTPFPNNFLGHYIGVSANNNIIRSVWTRVDNDLPSLWTAIIDSVTTVDKKPKEITPSGYLLYQNFPNPFNPKTIIKYEIPERSFVILKVYDGLGNEVVTLVDEEKAAGNYEVKFGASGLTSGIYFYQLKAKEHIETRKMLLLK